MILPELAWFLKILKRTVGTTIGLTIAYKTVHTIQAIISQKISGQQYMNNRLYAHRLRHPYSLVLDLDETLVKTTKIPRKSGGISIRIDGRQSCFEVAKRPHLEQFLLEMKNIYEIVIFTSSSKEYAETILNYLCINHLVDRRLYRDDCTKMANGTYTKDLHKVQQDVSKVILLDNNENAVSDFKDNLIPIASWQGSDSDTVLIDIIPLLTALRHLSDVRPVIRLRHLKSSANQPIIDQMEQIELGSLVRELTGRVWSAFYNFGISPADTQLNVIEE